ncbi:hypothetical protein [Nocardioides silvaticus]|nr:hypothetical protein [Nocardioides silvaticus]
MNTLTRTSVRTLAAVGSLALLVPAGAEAAAPAASTVTIEADGTDLFGEVDSPRDRCEKNREVVVYKQIGSRGGGNDRRFASDTTDDDGDWNTGNTGTEGRFYAKVKKTDRCKADVSPTIRATR